MQSSSGTFLCLWAGFCRPMPAGFCLREARESQCKSRQFLKKITCVDRYLLRAIKMSFLSFFLNLELHSKSFKGSATWISADETMNGYVGETHFQPPSWRPASFGDSWIAWGRVGGSCSSHHFLKMTEKLLGLPNRPAEHYCFCCWFLCWKQVRGKGQSLFVLNTTQHTLRRKALVSVSVTCGLPLDFTHLSGSFQLWRFGF